MKETKLEPYISIQLILCYYQLNKHTTPKLQIVFIQMNSSSRLQAFSKMYFSECIEPKTWLIT